MFIYIIENSLHFTESDNKTLPFHGGIRMFKQRRVLRKAVHLSACVLIMSAVSLFSQDTVFYRYGINGYPDMIESAIHSKTTAESGNYGGPVLEAVSSFC